MSRPDECMMPDMHLLQKNLLNWISMPEFKEHCQETKKVLGSDYAHVHRWLDAFYPKMGRAHWVMRHHKDGVEEVRSKWGDDAARAAEMHIRADYGSETIPEKKQAEEGMLFGPPDETLDGDIPLDNI